MFGNTKKSRRIILSVFVLAVVFGLGRSEKAYAGTCTFSMMEGTATVSDNRTVKDKTACDDLCRKTGEGGTGTGLSGSCKFIADESDQAKKSAIQNQEAYNQSTYGVDSSGRSSDGGFLGAILSFMGYLLSAATTLLISILDVKNINETIGNKIVYEIWAQIRDVMNIAFILVLLFSAFCTIFQVDKFNYKKILLTLVIMALLVNFSFPIARVIIDASNVIMYYFAKLAGFQATGDGGNLKKLVQESGIGKIISAGTTGDQSGSISYQIAAIIFTFIYAVTLLVIAVLFVVRLAVLTFLVMFSSVAFVGAIVPFLSTQAQKWWDSLFRYAFYGPIMIFMLYISTQIMGKMTTIQGTVKSVAAGQTQAVDVGIVSAIALFAIPITILWVGLGVAQSMNIALANEVAGRGQSFAKWGIGHIFGYPQAKWAGKTAKQIGGYGARWAERKVLMPIGLSPRAIMQGWKERSEEVDKRALGVAAGKARDFFHKMIDNTETNFGQLATDRVKAEEMKRFKEHSDDFQVLGSEMAKLVGSGADDAAERLCGVFRIAYGNRDQDEIMGYIRNNWERDVLGNGKSFKEIFKGQGENGEDLNKDDMVVNGYMVSKAVEVMLKNTGKDQSYINKELSDLGQVAAGNGSVGFGATKRDAATGKLVRTGKEEQAFLAARKHQTVFEPQDRAKKEHRNWETNEVNFDMINPEALEKMRWTSMSDLTQIERAHPSRQEQVGTNDQLMNSFYRELAKMRDGTLQVWDGKRGVYDEIGRVVNEQTGEKVQDNHEKQAYINAAHKAAFQRLSGVSADKIIDQLEAHGFKVEEINKILVQGKRDKDVLKRGADSLGTPTTPSTSPTPSISSGARRRQPPPRRR